MIYDLLIIGGGPAGYLAAERASQGGFSVILFEKKSLGGVCLNEGCIPTKTLLHSAKLYTNAKKGGDYGVFADNVRFEHAAVIKRKEKVVKMLTGGVAAKMRGHKVTVVNEKAAIEGKTENGFAVKAGENTYEGKRILIAAGSEAAVPPIKGVPEGIKSGFVMTSREILDIKSLPKKLCVIGGGVIGLEMAVYFASVGVEVTVIEMLPYIGGYIDGEISAMLLKELQDKGIDFKLGCKVTEITKNAVKYEQDGENPCDGEHEIKTDAVLLSVGRKMSSDGIGLENIGVYTEKGAVITDENLRTNVPNIYAAGDINGKSLLAHTAYREAEVAVNHMLNMVDKNHMLGKRDTMHYDAIPAVIYTFPEVACVGETEESAAEKGLKFTVKKLSMLYSGRFVAENENADGLCKILIENNSNRILGVHLIGSYSSEIIYGAAMMIESHWPVNDIKEIVFPHPTVSEIIRETLFS